MNKMSEFLPPVKERSLHKILSYMSGNVLCKCSDLLNGLVLIIYIAYLITLPKEVRYDWKIIVLIVLMLFIWSVAWHFVLTYIDQNGRRYVDRMLCYSKEYCDYSDSSEFEVFVDNSLKSDMIFRTRRFVLTKDIVLGCLDKGNEFAPVVILRKDVSRDSFYEKENWNLTHRGRPIHSIDGILELQMRNGKNIRFRVSEGNKNKLIRMLLTEDK